MNTEMAPQLGELTESVIDFKSSSSFVTARIFDISDPLKDSKLRKAFWLKSRREVDIRKLFHEFLLFLESTMVNLTT